MTCLVLQMQTGEAAALSVPKITLDEPGISASSVTGTVSVAKGQRIVLLGEDQKTVLCETRAPRSGSAAGFRLNIPSDIRPEVGSLNLSVKSKSARGVSASKAVPVTVIFRKAQKIKAPSKITLTNLKTVAVIGARADSGGKLTYKSSAPNVVSVSRKGKLTRRKNGRVTITVRQAGGKVYRPVKKKIRVISRKSTTQEQISAAVSWAVKIAADDSFAYGTGRGAHRYGCYFCGTNYGPRRYMKPSARYRKTYCCNPFVTAAYAHGAKHPKMLDACRRGSGIGMSVRTFTRYGCWKCVNKPAYARLRKGDVLVSGGHVALYIGKQKLAEAAGGNWSASSIAVRKMSRDRYSRFRFVMRYTGY